MNLFPESYTPEQRQRFTELVTQKCAFGLRRDNAEIVAAKQTAHDARLAEQAATESAVALPKLRADYDSLSQYLQRLGENLQRLEQQSAAKIEPPVAVPDGEAPPVSLALN